MFDVILAPAAQQELRALPLTIPQRVGRVLRRLQNWPDVSGAKPLRWALAGSLRIRTGDYRVQFRLDRHRLIVDRIGHRDGFYDD